MILCQCTRLSDAELREGATRVRACDPAAPLTPGRVFRACGRCVDCGDCRRAVAAHLAAQPACAAPLAPLAAE